MAWRGLDMQCIGVSDIDAFPSAVLAHHYPEVPNHGDLNAFREWNVQPFDLLVGGTPCQAFSVAGLRKGLDDPRGNLTLTYLALAARYRPRWILWENVPGVISDKTGAFASFLAGLGELGYGFAYRILNAQYFGVPQRRRRVFVVGCLGGWPSAAAVLFEPASLCRDITTRGKAGKDATVSPTLRAGGNRTGGDRPPGTDVDTADSLIISRPILANYNPQDPTMVTYVTGFNARQDPDSWPDRPGPLDTDGGTQAVFTLAIRGRGDSHDLETRQDGIANTILTPNGGRGGIGVGAVAFAENSRQELREMDVAGSLKTGGGKPGQSYPAIRQGLAVRRLTPKECERLQGFPDDYTAIDYRGKPAADGPRYKALGNSMAVPVMRWIGSRLVDMDSFL